MSFEQGHALLIGIGTHKYIPSADVPQTVADANAVAAVLCAPKACGYLPEQVKMIHADAATKAGILAALDDLAQRVGVDHTVFIFYCGHGAPGTDGNYYLVSHDAQIQGERIVAGTGVSEGELLDKLRAIKAQRVLMVFNACFSGNISPSLALVEPALETRSLSDETAAALLSTGSGRIIITACQETQKSYIGNGLLTIFTQTLADGLRGKGVANSNGYISAFDLYEYVFETVSETVNELYMIAQEPELTILKGAGSFAVALYRGATTLGTFDEKQPAPTEPTVHEVKPEKSQRIFKQRIVQSGGINPGQTNENAIQSDVFTGDKVIGPKIDTRQFGSEINTGGGTYAQGDVNTGNFVGRDQLIINIATQVIKDNEDRDEAQRIIGQYLDVLINDSAQLKLIAVNQSAAVGTDLQLLQLVDVYVDLYVDLKIPANYTSLAEYLAKPTLKTDEPSDVRSVSVIEALCNHRTLVLLGKPGSGKSTFGDYLMLNLAQAINNVALLKSLSTYWTLGPLMPIRVVLRQFASELPATYSQGRASDLWDFIKREPIKSGLPINTGNLLEDIARKYGALFLFDGLDECGDAKRQKLVLDAINEFRRSAGNHCHFVITARPYAWPGGANPQNGVYLLADLNYDQGKMFIQHWYESLTKTGWLTLAKQVDKVTGLLQVIKRPEWTPLAHNPLLLTLMATLHIYQDQLPAERVVLYNEVVDMLLQRWNERVGADRALLDELNIPSLNLSNIRSVIEKLAFHVHQLNLGKADVADIAESQLLNAFKPMLDSWDKAAVVVNYIEKRAGLLIAQGAQGLNDERKYAFPHHTFQEYLAGCHLSRVGNFAAEVTQMVTKSVSWREVILWSVGRLVYIDNDIDKPLVLVSELCSEIQPDMDNAVGWHKIGLAGQCLLVIGLDNIKSRHIGLSLIDQVRKYLTMLIISNMLTLRERTEYGAALRVLGDKRDINALLEMGRLYRRIGQPQEAQACYEQASGWASQVPDKSAQGYCQIELGELHRERSLYAQAITYFEKAAASFKGSTDEEVGLALLYQSQGTLASIQKNYQSAYDYYHKSLAIQEKLGDKQRIGSLLSNLGIVARNRGDYNGARIFFERSLEVRRELGVKWDISVSLINLGNLLHDQGHTQEAYERLKEGFDFQQAVGHRWGIANARHNLGNVIRTQGKDFAAAQSMYTEALILNRDLEDKDAIASLLEDMAGLAAAQAQAERSFILWGAAVAIREEIKLARPQGEKQRVEELLQFSQKIMSETAHNEAISRGKAMSLDQAIDYALRVS